MTALAFDSTHFCQSDAVGYLEMIYDSIYPRSVFVEDFLEEKIARVIAENSTEDYDCGLMVFPNPTDGIITIKIDDQLFVENAKIIISGSDGKMLKIVSLQDKNDEYNFDLSLYTPGTYYIILYDGSIVCIKKLIKQ